MTQANGFLFRKTVGDVTVPTWRAKLLVWMMPILFLGAGLGWLVSSFMWVSNAQETIGTVTQVYEQGTNTATDGTDVFFSPEFSYTWTDGSQTIGALGLSSPEFNFEIGSEHAILFDPSQKGNVRFPGFAFNYFAAIVILAISAMFALISLVLWIWVKNIARKRDLKKD